jgi:hypothetical protein
MPETKTQAQILSGNFEHHIALRKMPEWLGRESSITTAVYTHVSRSSFTKFKNPIVDLNFDDG